LARLNITKLAAFAMLLWIVLMHAPYWFIHTWPEYVNMRDNGPPTIFQVLGVALFCGVIVLFQPGRSFEALSVSAISSSRTLFLLFCLYTAATAPLSIDPMESLIFTVLHVAVFASLVVWWTVPEELERLLPKIGVWLFAYIVGLALYLGVRDRTIGWIPPNDVAKLAMVASVFCFFGSRNTKIFGLVAALTVILLTQSRGTLVSYVIFLALLQGFGRLNHSKLIAASAALVVVPAVLIVDLFTTNGASFAGLADQIFALSDDARGLDSGFTGRSGLWIYGTQMFWESPIMGYGLRTRAATIMNALPSPVINAHSGFLNMLLDVGVIGSLLLVLALVTNIWRRWRASKLEMGLGRSRIGFAFLMSAMFLWVLEPIYINLGAPFSLAMLLFIAAPIGREEKTGELAAGLFTPSSAGLAELQSAGLPGGQAGLASTSMRRHP
jgi:O-antigen ligase